MSAQRRCRRCSHVYGGYACPHCPPTQWRWCAYCQGTGCHACGRVPDPPVGLGCCLASCGSWIGVFVIAILLMPLITMVAHGNPLAGILHWLSNLKAPGSR
ncbi:hypothetical protein [Streptomyces sp. NPDC001480]|uniref:hypothetical protein n=1 Tax=Streptomyces sp. NPDC001480 TaxID=3364577 RepID=UPI00369085C2